MRSSKWLVFMRSRLAGFDRSLTLGDGHRHQTAHNLIKKPPKVLKTAISTYVEGVSLYGEMVLSYEEMAPSYGEIPSLYVERPRHMKK
jgi:hypothetical protein